MNKILKILGLTAILSLSLPTLSYAANQSERWVGSGERWQVSDNAGSYIKNCWFQDDVTGHWYLLGGEDGSVMYAGLVTDQSSGKTYLLNTEHDGTYGRMLATNGAYTINGKTIYLEFEQAHNGFYGAILNGLTEVRNSGVAEKNLSSIPTDSMSSPVSIEEINRPDEINKKTDNSMVGVNLDSPEAMEQFWGQYKDEFEGSWGDKGIEWNR